MINCKKLLAALLVFFAPLCCTPDGFATENIDELVNNQNKARLGKVTTLLERTALFGWSQDYLATPFITLYENMKILENNRDEIINFLSSDFKKVVLGYEKELEKSGTVDVFNNQQGEYKLFNRHLDTTQYNLTKLLDKLGIKPFCMDSAGDSEITTDLSRLVDMLEWPIRNLYFKLNNKIECLFANDAAGLSYIYSHPLYQGHPLVKAWNFYKDSKRKINSSSISKDIKDLRGMHIAFCNKKYSPISGSPEEQLAARIPIVEKCISVGDRILEVLSTLAATTRDEIFANYGLPIKEYNEKSSLGDFEKKIVDIYENPPSASIFLQLAYSYHAYTHEQTKDIKSMLNILSVTSKKVCDAIKTLYEVDIAKTNGYKVESSVLLLADASYKRLYKDDIANSPDFWPKPLMHTGNSEVRQHLMKFLDDARAYIKEGKSLRRNP